jgi:endonuclease III
MSEDTKTRLLDIYDLLRSSYGRRNKWWSESLDEIIIGAILTQNTNWQNVEKALANLREEKVLSLEKLAMADQMHLATQIKPAGYHNQKARVLIGVAKAVLSYEGAYNLAEYRPFFTLPKGHWAGNSRFHPAICPPLTHICNRCLYYQDFQSLRFMQPQS